MKPLHLVGLGLVLVAFDFRLPAFDLLADPLGWLALAVGCWRLGMSATAAVGLVGTVASLPWVVLPHHLEEVETMGVTVGGRATVMTVEVLVFDDLVGVRLAAAAMAAAVLGIVVW